MIDCDKMKRVPLTSSQKELWLSQFASASGFQEVASRACFPVSCRLEPELLRDSIEIALRHTPLLTASLIEEDGEPFFESGAPSNFNFQFLDVSGTDDPEKAAKEFFDEFFELPVGDPLTHFALVWVDPDKSIYGLKNSHIVIDGMGNFFNVSLVADIYQTLKNGREYPVEDGANHAEQYQQDKKYLESKRSAKDIAFWEKHLSNLPQKRIFRALPGRPDVLGDTHYRKYYLSKIATEVIERIVERYSISPAVYFSAIHALIVGFMCDERQIVIQTPIAFGERKSIKKRQGAQLSLPPLLVDLDKHETFDSILKGIAVQNSQFYRNIRTPYQMGMRRIDGHQFDYVSDLFMNYLPQLPKGNQDFPVITMEQHHSSSELGLFGALVTKESENGLFSFSLRRSGNHLREQDSERYIRRVELISEQLERGVGLADLDYLLDEEKAELAQWQHGPETAHPHSSIPALFDETVESFRDALAVRDEHGGCLTYLELRENSVRCAYWLAEQGVKPGDVVAVMAERTLNLPEVVLGIMRCGGVYLPLDPKSPSERLDHIVTDAGAKLTIDLSSSGHLAASSEVVSSSVVPDKGAYLIYTSGSTGRPKGVLAPHAGFLNMIRSQIDTFGVTADDRVLLFASPAFDASLSEMFMGLLAGACLYPVGETFRHDPWALKRYMADHQVSVVTFPPSYLHLFDGEPFSGLRVLITAGEPPVAGDALRYAEQLTYFNAYGPTETCVCASMKRVGVNESLPISVGKPISNGTVRIMNSRGSELPAGMVGELWVGGASLSLGYYKQPELTAKQFRSLPGVDEQVNYATGDLALWTDNGELMLVGRADDQVKIRGNRVELGEVAFQLELCPSVRQAQVLAKEDTSGQPALVAFLVSANGFTLNDVVAWAQGNLPVYMIPSEWHVLETMPVTVTGKVDRKALLRLTEKSGKSSREQRALDGRLAALCEQALGKTCDPELGFFDQGGNSLNGMAFLHSIRKEFSVDIPFRELMKSENLFDVELILKDGLPLLGRQSGRDVPLCKNQYQLWAYQHVNEGSIDYNMPLLLGVTGERAEPFLEAILRAVREQELLSSIISGEIDNPVFKRVSRDQITLNMTELPDAEAASAFIDEQVHRPFDLRKEPPVRLEAIRLGDDFQVLVMLHHIVGDGESLQIILRNALNILDNVPSEPGLLATQAAYGDRELAYLQSADRATDAAYWRQLLADPPPSLNDSSVRKGGMSRVLLTPEHVDSLEQFAARSGVSVLACFATLVSRFLCDLFQRSEILVGMPVGVRETRDEFNSAGFYVNTVPLRIGGDSESDIAATMRETAGQVRLAVGHGRCRDFDVVPDVVVTHSVFESTQAEGLLIRPLEMILRASKLTASFVLETGESQYILMEHDKLFISDGDSLLHDFRRFVIDTCAEGVSWDKEQLLADVWEELLGTRPNDKSDFLREGGDSIKAIQMVGRLGRCGLSGLTAADFLRTPGFSELVQLLTETDDESGDQVVFPPLEPGQHIPLLPLQRELIQNHPEHWKSFDMVLPMEIRSEVEEEQIATWVQELPERFEAFCLAFDEEGARFLAKPQRIALHKHEFDGAISRKEILRTVHREIAAGLDPEAGRTLGAGLVEYDGMRLFILAGHHLVLDAVSFDILRQDLTAFCRTGRGVVEQHGVATRAVEIARLEVDGEFPSPQERRFWEAVCGTPAGQIHVEQAGQLDLAAERDQLWEQLDGFLLEHTSSAQADLLSALSSALYVGGQRDAVFVALESHGRDSLPEGFEPEHTVGWFTAVCPMPLKPSQNSDVAHREILPWISEHFTPRNGNAYGVLKGQAPNIFSCASRIGFNYFGKIADAAEDLFTPLMAETLPGDIPALLHPDFSPDIPLELTVYFDDSGVLHLGAYFSPKVLPEAWVDSLLQSWAAALKKSPAYRKPLSNQLMSRIREECCCTDEDIEAVHLPEKNHVSMLHDHWFGKEGLCTVQLEFLFRGKLDEVLLTKAWAAVVARHESLRSLFPTPYPDESYRVVLKRPRMNVEFHDLGWVPEQMASARMEDVLMRERERVFDVAAGPLLSTQFFRLSNDRFKVSWCMHHILMDGWGIGILLRELFSVYSALETGTEISLPEPMPLSDYAAWLARADEPAARNHWNSLLDGFEGMTPVARRAGEPSNADPEVLDLDLDEEFTGRLQSVANDQAVTPAILLQCLWAILLSTRNDDCRDVVFPLVNSGRPAELAGIEQAVGLFRQNVPVRVCWSDTSHLDDLLRDVKKQSLGQMKHGNLSLSDIWGDLVDHHVVIENYPVGDLSGGRGLELLEVKGFERDSYPLTVVILPEDSLHVRFECDPAQVPLNELKGVRDDYHALLQAVALDGIVACAALEKRVGQK